MTNINLFQTFNIRMTSPKPQKKRKTRHSSGSKVSEYLGGGKELLPSEVQTLRSALQKAHLIQEGFMFQDEGDRPKTKDQTLGLNSCRIHK